MYSTQFQTQEERAQLIKSLDKRGLVDITKAYLKSNLLESLKSSSTKGTLNSTNSIPFNTTMKSTSKSSILGNPLLKLSVSLIEDFMVKYGLNYSLSTLQSEAKSALGTSYPYTESEMMGILNISLKQLNEYKDETNNTFLSYVLKDKSKLFRQETESQTEINLLNNPLSMVSKDEKDKFISIDEQLKNIDNKYNSKLNLENLLPSKFFEDRFNKFKKETEAKYQEDLNNSMKRFKEIELAQMRIEENKKYVSKLENLRDQYENEFQAKLEEVKKRENENKLRLDMKEKELERVLFENRQKYQDEINRLKEKEIDIDQRLKNELTKIKLTEEKLELKIKENEDLKENSLRRITDQVEQYKKEYDLKFLNEKKDFENEKTNFRIQNSAQMNLLEKYKISQTEKTDLMFNIDKLKNENVTLTTNNGLLTRENEKLRAQLMNMNSQVQRMEEKHTQSELEKTHLSDQNKILKDSLRDQKYIYQNSLNNQQNILRDAYNQSALNLSTGSALGDDKKYKSLEKKIKSLQEQIRNQPKGVLSRTTKFSKIRNRPATAGGNCSARRRIENFKKLEEEQFLLNKDIKNEFKSITSTDYNYTPNKANFDLNLAAQGKYDPLIIQEENEKYIHQKFEEMNKYKNPEFENNRTQNRPNEVKVPEGMYSDMNLVQQKNKIEESKNNTNINNNPSMSPSFTPEPRIPTPKNQKQEIKPTPKIISDSNSNYIPNKTDNNSEISVENISNNSNEWNIQSDKSRKDLQSGKLQKQGSSGKINASIKEEIDENASRSQSNNNSALRKSGDSKNKSKSSSVNKFQNVAYDSKDNNENITEDIEDYGSFDQDVDGLEKNKQSLDLEAYKNASIGQQNKGRGNISVSSIQNKSNNSISATNIEKFLQSKPSNIEEENIEEDISNDKSNRSLKKVSNSSAKKEESSDQYNDFVHSNAFSKKDQTGKSNEIAEEIMNENDSDDDAYHF